MWLRGDVSEGMMCPMIRWSQVCGPAVALGLLIAVGCSSPGSSACPSYRVTDGVTVEASAYFASHAAAAQICVNGMSCVPVRAHSSSPPSVFLPYSASSILSVRVKILTRTDAVLLDTGVRVPLRQEVIDAACGIDTERGSVTVTREGTLRIS